MKKTIVIIFTLVFALMCFSVAAENSSTVSTTGPPPLLNIYGNSYAADGQSLNQDGTSRSSSSAVPQTALGEQVQPGFAVPSPLASTGIGSPLAGGPGILMPPGAPPLPPGAGLSGAAAPSMAGGYGYSAAYSINITLEKIQQVLSTVRRTRKYLKPGKLWVLRGPGGELEIRGGIVYQGAVVSVVEFNPVNGSVLPAEYRPVAYQENVSLKTIRKQLDTIVTNLQILKGVWYREPEGCWIVPLAYKGEVITSLKIYYDGIHVIPDYEAAREMAYNGS
ncbi:MAG: hypothetical protein GXP33_12790 [Spirochaetes bacterium]|nr:hypothetical protein [Spirochaetota bacterium]